MASENGARQLVALDPATLQSWAADDGTVLVDVREGFEHAAERIEPSLLHAMSGFNAPALRDQCAGKRVVFYCRTGRRSADAAQRFGQAGEGGEETYHLQGGIEQWKREGLATRKSASAPKIDVMRQVQITAGSLVLTGVLLAWLVTPWAMLLSAFVGAGLVFAGASGWCGMARLLAFMPWNRVGAEGT